MMRRPISAVLLIFFLLTGCSQKIYPSDFGFTLRSALRLFEEQGIDTNPAERPLFETINARNGAIFYVDEELVRIYEFTNEEDFKKGVKDLTILRTFPKRELLVIETLSEKAIEIFMDTPIEPDGLELDEEGNLPSDADGARDPYTRQDVNSHPNQKKEEAE